MLCTPTPATEGSNVPRDVSVIPAPLQVPPGVTAVKFVAAAFKQNGPAGFIVASGAGVTVIVPVAFKTGPQPPVSGML